MIHLVEKILDKHIRPSLAQHGGNIEVIDIDNETLFIRFVGGCHGCSSSKITLKNGVERIVKEHFREIKEIVDITDHAMGKNPYM